MSQDYSTDRRSVSPFNSAPRDSHREADQAVANVFADFAAWAPREIDFGRVASRNKFDTLVLIPSRHLTCDRKSEGSGEKMETEQM